MFIVLVRSERPAAKAKFYKYPTMSKRVAFECANFLSGMDLIPDNAVAQTADMIAEAGYAAIPCIDTHRRKYVVAGIEDWTKHFDVKAVIDVIEVGNESK